MRATLVLAGLALAALLVSGCDSDRGSTGDYDGRYDDQYRGARTAGDEIDPYQDHSSNLDWHRYRDDENY